MGGHRQWRPPGGGGKQGQVDERLSAADASNVVLDAADQVNVVLLAGLLGPGGWVSPAGKADLDRLRAVVADRLGRQEDGPLRRFSQRVVPAGRHLVWVPCRSDLTLHVRTAGPVDGRAGFADLCASLMTQPLPKDRPLWELLVAPRAAPEGPGIVLRVHHAVADGAAGVGLLHLLLDHRPGTERQDAPLPPTAPAPAPPTTHAPASPATPAPGPPVERPGRLSTWLTGVSRVVAVVRARIPPTVLLGPIGAHRGIAFAEVDVGPLARGARGSGATVNDALLAAVATAVEAALAADGHPVPPVLPASVPVALPDHRGSGNAVGVMLVDLPTGEPDAGRRLAVIAATTAAAKADARRQGTLELTRTRWGARLFARLARRQRLVALFVTNVRGPRDPLALGGAPLRRAWPVTPLQGNVRLGISALSYAGRLGCTVHVDGDVLRADLLAAALQEELQSIAGRC